MHDLLRDVCLREPRKLKFLYVLEKLSIPEGINSQRRIVSFGRLKEYQTPLLQSLESESLVWSFIGVCPTSVSNKFRLSRVCSIQRCYEKEDNYKEIFVRLVNLCLLTITLDLSLLPRTPSSLPFYSLFIAFFFWNLQTIYFSSGLCDEYLFEIWKVSLLRHVISDQGECYAYSLPDPLSDEATVGFLGGGFQQIFRTEDFANASAKQFQAFAASGFGDVQVLVEDIRRFSSSKLSDCRCTLLQ